MTKNDESAPRGRCRFQFYRAKAMVLQVIRAGCQARTRFTFCALMRGPDSWWNHTRIRTFVMPNWSLWTVRILRRLPHTQKYDAHLTNCAALELIYRPFGDVSE